MEDKPLPYKPANLLTPAEEIFFNTVLNPILNDEFYISFKTKLRDLVKIEDDHKNNNYWNETDKHIDFLICNKIDPSDIKLAIELDDSSHDDEDTKLAHRVRKWVKMSHELTIT
jgi:hypothetical protein